MARIVPFRALRYNLTQIGDAAAVIATPYDVISPTLQEDHYQRNSFNIVRLTLSSTFLPRTGVGDSD